MSIDLPLGRLNWTGVSDEKSNRRVKCDPTLGCSAFPDRNSTVYLPLGFRKSEMIQRMAGSPAPGQDSLRMQKASASKADVIAAIRLEALIQTAYHVLNRPEDLLLLPATGDLLPRYFAWVRQYCDTHYLHFLHDYAWGNPLTDLNSACTYPTRLADQQQLGRRSKEVGDFSRRHLDLPFRNNGDNVKLGKPVKLPAKPGSPEQCKTSCTEERTFEVFSEYSSRQKNKASPVCSAVCSRERLVNDILSLSEALQILHTKRRSVNAMSGLAESEGIKAVNIILTHLRTAARDSEQDGEVETQRTGTSSTQGQNDHGRGVQKHQRHATWPSVVGKKRSANAEDSSDEDDDEKRPRKAIAKNEKSTRFACPYYQYDPGRFAGERSCCGPGWTTVQRMKEHLFRKHKAPDHQCPRCFKKFENNQLKMQHCQAQETCEIGKSPSASGQLDENAMRLLKQRGKTTATESEKWYSVYQILFPMETSFPSPYYEQKGKVPELPPRIVAQDMFRENLDGVISRWGLGETHLTAGKSANTIVNLVRYGAIAAFDETLSALYRQRVSPALDDRIPAIEVSDPEREDQVQWLWPLVEDLDAEGKNSSQGHKVDDVSECALTHCSSSILDTETWELGTEEVSISQTSNRKALTAPVSVVDQQTVVWLPQLHTSSASQSLQRQSHQQRQGWVLPGQKSRKVPLNKCSFCGSCYTRTEHLRRHQLGCRRNRPMERYVATSTSTSCPRQGRSDSNVGPLTPVQTPEEGNGRTVVDYHLPDDGIVHNDQLFEVFDDDFIGDIPETEVKEKGVEREGRVLDTDTSNHRILSEVGFYEPPAVLSPWHSGLGGLWSPNNQNGNSQTITDDPDFEDTGVSPYLRGNENYGP